MAACHREGAGAVRPGAGHLPAEVQLRLWEAASPEPHLLPVSVPNTHKGLAPVAVSLSVDNCASCQAQSMCLDFPTNQPAGVLPVSFLLQAADAKGLWLGHISPCVLCRIVAMGVVGQEGHLCPETL